MKLEITKMQLSDFEQIKENLTKDFDDFWSTNTLKEELENKNRTRFTLHSSKAKSRNFRLCRNNQYYRRSKYHEHCCKKRQKKFRNRLKTIRRNFKHS